MRMIRFMMMLVIAAVAALATATNCSDPFCSTQLNFPIPHELYRPEGYGHREAHIGTPHYGGKISQNVYYTDQNICEGNLDTRRGYPARDYDDSGRMKPWESPFILMFDRNMERKGGCSFVRQVRNAQEAGAAAVIVAEIVCIEEDGVRDCPGRGSGGPWVYVSDDDGFGSNVTISVFAIFKEGADKVRDVLLQNRPVRAEMSWMLPTKEHVEYDVWLDYATWHDTFSPDFVSNFRDIALALGEHATFTPHIQIGDEDDTDDCWYHDDPRHDEICDSHCTNKRRYCSFSDATVEEKLRQMCIWKHYGKDGIGVRWWDYMSAKRTCDSLNKPDCVNKAYESANIDAQTIEFCMRDSGGLEGNNNNVTLQELLDDRERLGIWYDPVVYVNNARVQSELSLSNVFKAICAGYTQGSVPMICNECAQLPDPLGCVRYITGRDEGADASSSSSSSKKAVSMPVFFISIIVLVGAFGMVGLFYYKKTKREMKTKVRDILAEYVPLEDGGDQTDDGSPPSMGSSREEAVSLS